MRSKIKEPTGKERMRRHAPKDLSLRPKRIESDIKKAYTQEQLTEIGAITLIWNQITAFITFLLYVVVDPSSSTASSYVWSEILKRLNNLDETIAILCSRSEESDILNDDAKKAIRLALDAVLEYRRYRNGIVHSSVFDHEKGIAQYIDSNKTVWQILLTKEALTAFYERLVILKDELRAIDALYRISQGSRRVTRMNDKTGQPEPDQPKALREKSVPEQTARVLIYQGKRLALKPLPKFPDEHLIFPKMRPVEIHPTSDG